MPAKKCLLQISEAIDLPITTYDKNLFDPGREGGNFSITQPSTEMKGSDQNSGGLWASLMGKPQKPGRHWGISPGPF